MKQFLFLLIICMLSSCGSRKNETSDLLVGTWSNTFMKIEMNTYKGKDTINVLEVNESNWEGKMGIKPIITYFKEDGTYNSEHRNLNDSIIYNPAGKWEIVGDTLLMKDTFPQIGLNYKYKLLISKQRDKVTAEFWGIEDFDQDGKKDDVYYGKQRKF
ncbi:MAG: hypothetical protein JNL24_02025 [Bacteroidia bacterium]|nr:hypothetical protein [Bacteroidia bacterium]